MICNAVSMASIEAVVFPPCEKCNAPYRPSKPVVDYGTIHFQSKDWIANFLYVLESAVKKVRIARLRRL